MTLLAFLPVRSLALLQILLPNEEISAAKDWAEVHTLAATSRFTAIVIDPNADGLENIAAATEVVKRNAPIPVFAYVSPTPASLRAVFLLSRHGLADAFCWSEFNPAQCWPAILHRATHNFLSHSFLRLIESRLGRLPYPLACAVCDVFESPHLYDHVDDLARKAGLGGRSVYRALKRAGLGTPKKILAVAKILRGVTYMQSAPVSVTSVSGKIKYSQPRVFCQATERIFRCSPSALRQERDSGAMLVAIVEWLYKPNRSSIRRRPTPQNGGAENLPGTLRFDKAPRAVTDDDEYGGPVSCGC
jgi:AraC-like DNA-binding protein